MLEKLLSLKRIFKVWLVAAARAAQVQLLTGWSGYLFILGKVVSFLLFFLFIFQVLSTSQSLVGFTREQVIFFFLVFNLVDIMLQFLFRGVYHFRNRVVRGDFDLDLVKPLPSFFRPIFGWTDILDLITLLPLWAYFFWFVNQHQLLSSFESLALFFLLLVNSLLIGFSIHLLAVGVGVITMEVDHLILIYRDMASMARFPTGIYHRGIQYILTFTIPVVILFTVPAKALLGFLSWPWVVGSFLMGLIFLFGSFKFWRFALSRYASASS